MTKSKIRRITSFCLLIITIFAADGGVIGRDFFISKAFAKDQPQKRHCEEMGLTTQSACAQCAADPAMTCVPARKDDYFQKCFECREKKGKEIDCAYYGMPSRCPACQENQKCVPLQKEAGDTKIICYECQNKHSCEDMGLAPESSCTKCVEDPTMTCAPSKKDDYFQKCFECRKKKGGEIDCSYYGMPSQCPACPENQRCVPVKKEAGGINIACYECQNKRDCGDKGLVEQSACAECLDDPTKICAPVDKNDYGQQCFECREKKDREIDCAYYGMPSQCPACQENQKCVPLQKEAGDTKITCYECQNKRSCEDMGLVQQSACVECQKDPSMMCVPAGKDDFFQQCFECRRKKDSEIDCAFYKLEASCDACQKYQICGPETRQAGKEKITCYRCENKRNCRQEGLIPQSDCAECTQDPAMMCQPEGTSDYDNPCFKCVKKQTCQDLGFLGEAACNHFVQKNSYMRCQEKATANTGEKCYECVKKESCANLGFAPSCRECGEGVRCEKVIKDIDGTQLTCYECIARVRCHDLGLMDEGSCKDACWNSPSCTCEVKGNNDYGEPCYEPVRKTSPPETGPKSPDDSIKEAGVIIVATCVKNRVTITIYDTYGRKVAEFDQQNGAPGNLNDILRKARDGQGSSFGASQDGPSVGDSNSVMALDKNIGDKEISGLANRLGEALKRSGDCEKIFDSFIKESGVHITEKVLIRDVQGQEGPIVPNDPFFLDTSTHKGAKGVELLKHKLEKTPGVTLGAGEEKGRESTDQWGLHAVGFLPLSHPDSAWNLVNFKDKNVIVAVIDSGLDLSHPDGPQYLWANSGEIPENGVDDDNNGFIDDIHGWNFLNENNDLTDYKGHGTFVTGIIAAKSGNAIAIAGINPGAQIMVLKAANKDGKARSVDIYRALCYAADHGARVINISLGNKGVSALEQEAVDYAYSKGSLIVVAAGNQSQDLAQYGPPALRKVLVISAADPSGKRIWSSNTGANVALTAPGRSIFSLYSKDSEWPGPAAKKADLCYKAEGTSFAAPFVTATASLLLAKNPQLTHEELEDILLDSAVDLEEEGWDQYTGAGFLDAAAALAHPPGPILTARFMSVAINKESGKISSIDVYGVVRGEGVSYSVDLAKGKKSDQWQKVFESQNLPSSSNLLCRIDAQHVSKGTEWSLRLTARDKNGKTKHAKVSFELIP